MALYKYQKKKSKEKIAISLFRLFKIGLFIRVLMFNEKKEKI